jgi:hypothetical protein
MIEPAPRTHGNVSYRHPADIDGEPDEVAQKSIAALADATAIAHEVAKATFAQVRNAHLDELGSELSGEAVLDWEAGLEGRSLATITERLESVRIASRVLAQRAREAV